MAKSCPGLQLESTGKRNCSASHCPQSLRLEITRSRSVSLAKSISKGRDFFTCVTKSRGAERKKSCSEHSLKRLMLADFFLVGMNRLFVPVSIDRGCSGELAGCV